MGKKESVEVEQVSIALKSLRKTTDELMTVATKEGASDFERQKIAGLLRNIKAAHVTLCGEELE